VHQGAWRGWLFATALVRHLVVAVHFSTYLWRASLRHGCAGHRRTAGFLALYYAVVCALYVKLAKPS
jgi:hypothetical protein